MASRSVNKVTLIGHLGRDAETAYTASQTAVTKFSVATNRRWKDQASGEWKEETNWTNVVLWRGENVAPYSDQGQADLRRGPLADPQLRRQGRQESLDHRGGGRRRDPARRPRRRRRSGRNVAGAAQRTSQRTPLASGSGPGGSLSPAVAKASATTTCRSSEAKAFRKRADIRLQPCGRILMQR